ncbi:mismatch-specific DNA-glycosylase [Microbacterium sp. zg.B48]|uniref:mismatch-specific DNA-glycosylase n=1 Tax=unclassified Microbacterium TaxID=2609290 RepID=UPI00214CBACD|nr:MULTISPECIES: mismatch-specific DNA-glycosylase [unclassified Microbacterium]MCR2763392.1 mismatch-specific DNA-glycosylase [Microbacterium sp. zg.B48]MCR2809113.1 mismatch-specific DNA-glycosylase [Microbacterium sp. zg.B185]WIM20266.1 mismatch-specific DNA-glycosylase [Microbacterium sp. zg-B185]
MGFTRAELESFRDRSIPEFVPPHPRLLFVGINPGLWTAATGTPFARPGNRFYPALVAAGIIPRMPRIPDAGMPAEDRAMFFDSGIGIASIVPRATARADELTRQELRDGAARLVQDIARWRPGVVAVVGLTAYRQGFDHPEARQGRQPERIAEAELWVLPNPSGLNAHETVRTLAAAYAAPARAAGIIG